jgi:hypothetical protein
MATGWTDRDPFPERARDFPLFHSVQPNSGAHPASYPIDTLVDFLGGLSSWGVKLMSSMVELYVHSPVYIHGRVLN